MLIDAHHVRVQLDRSAHALLQRARGIRLTAIEGVTWITVDRELRDIVIGPGESFVVPSDGKVVVVAIRGPAVVAVESQAGAVRCVSSERDRRPAHLWAGLRTDRLPDTVR
jgi:hypothetical protein